MTTDLGHGPRLTDEEYDRRVVRLQQSLPPMPTREQEHRARQQQLNLAIDHRLGADFPQDRRDALWAIMERVEKRRLRLAARYALRFLFRRSHVPAGLANRAQGLAGFMVEAFAEVLNEQELQSFFGLEPGERPHLPLP